MLNWRKTTWTQWIVAGTIFILLNYGISVLQAASEHPR